MVIRALTAAEVEAAYAIAPRTSGDERSRFPAVAPREERTAAREKSGRDGRAAYPRMTVSEYRVETAAISPFATAIPRAAVFYDEVERIAKGRYERGRLVDQNA
ncbi:MAG: hypothetical protein IT350_11025 [Deltaproteobacteria bacterium]|nr:hypothetical protein [Deltaproteobacteria bacterium]